MALPFMIRRPRGSEGIRERGGWSWISRRSPHPILPEGPAGLPVHGAYEEFGAADPRVVALTALIRTSLISGTVLGALFGLAAAGTGRRLRGAFAGTLLGSLTGFAAGVYGAQTAILAGQAAVGPQKLAVQDVVQTVFPAV